MLRTADTSRFAKVWVIAAIALMAHWAVPNPSVPQTSPVRTDDGPGLYAAERVALGTLPRLVALTANLERSPHKPDAVAWLDKNPPAANSSLFEMRCPAAAPVRPAAAVVASAKRSARVFEARGPPA